MSSQDFIKGQLSADYTEPLLLSGTGTSREGKAILKCDIQELAYYRNDSCYAEC
jgi:hypothetical protein